MSEPEKTYPPRWAERFLAWYCRADLLEDLQGDLNEYFQRNLKAKGARRARITYILDVFKFLRLYTIRKPEFINLLIHWIMIGSYIKTSGRSIVRNKLFSAINIFGLSVSMGVGLVLIAMLSDLLSYDKFHDNHKRIYRVISQYQYMDKKDDGFLATTSLKAATRIKETFAGVENVAILRRELPGDVSFGDKTIPLSGFWANEAIFNVFSFKLLQGNPATALKEPFSIVLTEKSALKLFDNTNVLGKIVTLNKDRDYTITGVVEDVPVFSHIKFDMLGSISTRDITEKDPKEDWEWDSVWNTWAYLLLPQDSDLTTLKNNLNELSKKEDKSVAFTHIELDLQPMDTIMTGENLSNEIGTVLGGTIIWVLAGLSFVVILSACFNYTNLSIARSLKRSKEVGIRKTIGAVRGHVINQFIIESVIIALSALVIAFSLFLLIKPHFLSIEQSLQNTLALNLSPKLILLFILFAIIVGISAGFFPAVFFSKINAVQVLKSQTGVPALKGLTLRKVLIVFQYTISIIFITGTIVIYKQYKHFMAYDLGFKTENILNINLQGNKAELLKKEINELPEVKGISQSLMITSIGNYWGTKVRNPNDPNDSTNVYYNTIDENYLPLHEHKLIAGNNFASKTGKVEESEVIVNQHVLKRFNIAKQIPTKAIDEIIRVDGKDLRIIGVIKDFEYGRANGNGDKEVLLRYSNEEAQYLNVKMHSNDWIATHAKLESIWKKIDPVHPLDAKFYNEQLEEAFNGLKASVKIGGFLAFLVICISSIGLLGMVIFTTETRVKEISIRKVLGANEGKLMYLLSKGFIILLSIAAGIALPITYMFFEKILFPEIANHAPLSLTEMLTGVLVIMVIAVLMIGSQTLKVARTNPAEVLKNE
jgi:ABC-type antimicrobial peptide transport system permease subunit